MKQINNKYSNRYTKRWTVNIYGTSVVKTWLE